MSNMVDEFAALERQLSEMRRMEEFKTASEYARQFEDWKRLVDYLQRFEEFQSLRRETAQREAILVNFELPPDIHQVERHIADLRRWMNHVALLRSVEVARQFVLDRLAHGSPTNEVPYRSEGSHVLVGPERPLAEDFLPSHAEVGK
jgi:hypothetical protein